MTERIKTPHPHAGLMMEYAKDCLTDSEAWRNWEFCYAPDKPCQNLGCHPQWFMNITYRRKPNKVIKKFINGIEVPMHLTEKPKLGEIYYCIDSVINVGDHRIGVDAYEWSNDRTDYALYESNNCFATEEDAQANLDAIQKFELREVEELVTLQYKSYDFILSNGQTIDVKACRLTKKRRHQCTSMILA